MTLNEELIDLFNRVDKESDNDSYDLKDIGRRLRVLEDASFLIAKIEAGRDNLTVSALAAALAYNLNIVGCITTALSEIAGGDLFNIQRRDIHEPPKATQ